MMESYRQGDMSLPAHAYVSDGEPSGAQLLIRLNGPEGTLQAGQKFAVKYKGHQKGELHSCSELTSKLMGEVQRKESTDWPLIPLFPSREEVWGFRSADPAIPSDQSLAREKSTRYDEELTVCIYDDETATALIAKKVIEVRDSNKVLFKKIPDTFPSATEYGQECAKEIGYLKPFNCLDPAYSVEVPITVDGQPVSKQVAECDRPSWFPMSFGTCVPGNRMGRLTTYRDATYSNVNPDADTIFTCRRLHVRTAPDDPVFDDIAMIQHDRRTGKTCFFQQLTSDSGPKSSLRIPPPHEVTLPSDAGSFALPAHRFWIAPFRYSGFECTGCHDSDPFIHSPLVENLVGPDGKPLVPSDPRGPYQLVGSKYPFKKIDVTWSESASVRRAYNWPDVKSIRVEGDNTCTSCHRIGDQRTCEDFVWFSSGWGNRGSFSNERDSSEARRPKPAGSNATAMKLLAGHWMPPDHHLSAAEWDRKYLEGFKKIAYCCGGNVDVPAGTKCVNEPLITMPP